MRYEVRNDVEVWYRPTTDRATPWRIAVCDYRGDAAYIANALNALNLTRPQMAMLAGANIRLHRICDAMERAGQRAADELAKEAGGAE